MHTLRSDQTSPMKRIHVSSKTLTFYREDRQHISNVSTSYGLPIVYGRPYCNDAKEGVGGIIPPKLNRGG